MLVDDRPGVEEDRAHFMATARGERPPGGPSRQGDDWSAERDRLGDAARPVA